MTAKGIPVPIGIAAALLAVRLLDSDPGIGLGAGADVAHRQPARRRRLTKTASLSQGARILMAMEPVTFRFAYAARRLGQEARRLGLQTPAFRSPPRVAGAARTLRRRTDGGAVVAVALRDRPWSAVAADLVDGVIVANRLDGVAADRARAALWAAIDDTDRVAA